MFDTDPKAGRVVRGATNTGAADALPRTYRDLLERHGVSYDCICGPDGVTDCLIMPYHDDTGEAVCFVAEPGQRIKRETELVALQHLIAHHTTLREHHGAVTEHLWRAHSVLIDRGRS